MKKQHIASLILKERIEELSNAEKEELTFWLQESPRNKKIYAYLRKKDLSTDVSRYQSIRIAEGLEKYHRRYAQKQKRIYTRWYWAVAVAILFFSVSALFFYQEKPTAPVSVAITPGSSKAMLILNNGNIIDLSKRKTEVITNQKLSIKTDGTQLSYSVTEDSKDEPTDEYNELIIPKGGEFTLTLSDGTKVWLNSQSKIKYPVIFNNITREVYLEGEAYFEVSKNKEKPFLVQVDDMSVKVYGTEFNVNTYNKIETVLVTGSVGMNQGGKEVLLKPNQKGVFDQVSGKITVEDVDVLAYVSWKNGDFIFRNESLNSIMDKLSRWYGLEVLYQDAGLQDVRLSGNLKRYKDVRELFVSFEKISDARFKVQGNKVIVSSK